MALATLLWMAAKEWLDIGNGVLADFEEHAASVGGMDEEIEVAASADLNVVGDESRALGFEGFEGGGDVVDMQGDVVKAFSMPGEEAADRRVGGGRLKEFDAGVAGGDESGADLLVFDGFFANNAETKALIEGAGLGNATDRDADVIEGGHGNRV